MRLAVSVTSDAMVCPAGFGSWATNDVTADAADRAGVETM